MPRQSSIALSATNPCHLYHLARALHRHGNLASYFSGYPKWRLPGHEDMPILSFPTRTTVVYSLLRYTRPPLRPQDRTLFKWQDHHFDAHVARSLSTVKASAIHAMPGQCRETFRRARQLGLATILNHATGPVCHLAESLSAEYARVGLRFEEATHYDEAYREQVAEEMALADYHCVGSTVVAEQIAALGVAKERLWVVPYGADQSIFHPAPSNLGHPGGSDRSFRIVFAGQLTLRKGVRFLLDAVREAGHADWIVDFYGRRSVETEQDIERYHGSAQLQFHGAVSQKALATAFQTADVLVLPSLEEGFGLVVAQALNCGLPCIVSDSTGAKDLIHHHRTGSIVPTGDAHAIARELQWVAPTTPTLPRVHHLECRSPTPDGLPRGSWTHA